MTASVATHDVVLDRTASAADLGQAAVDRLTPVGLDVVTERAELLTRVDRKYFVPATLFGELAGRLAGDYGVLDIAGRRLFGYESTYFDTPDLVSYRHHLQGRRRRFKVRVRTYLDSGDSMLEVKLKGHRGATVKHRTSHLGGGRRVLTPAGHQFVAGVVADAYGLRARSDLVPTIVTANHRSTLASVKEGARVTCDVGVACGDGQRVVRMNRDVVLVETKAGPAGSLADRWMRELGLRPVSVSKYCAGVALLRPEVASNPWHRILRRHFDAPIASLAHPSAVS
ncbi:MAG: polyphosphate polymerase domain-containing protein [Nocardioidaceae bacterium]